MKSYLHYQLPKGLCQKVKACQEIERPHRNPQGPRLFLKLEIRGYELGIFLSRLKKLRETSRTNEIRQIAIQI